MEQGAPQPSLIASIPIRTPPHRNRRHRPGRWPPEFAAPTYAGQRQGDRRDITLGLRFRVLHRDRFNCVLCGDGPAANPSCVLHVDHILPWSKGGRTAIDNLRSLCGLCNVGRVTDTTTETLMIRLGGQKNML